MKRLPRAMLWALGALVSAALVGRRLGVPILGAALLLSGVLAALAFGLGLAATVALLTVVGASRALLDVASRTLMQRSVPAQLLGRVFGVLEGLTMAGLAAGSLLVAGVHELVTDLAGAHQHAPDRARIGRGAVVERQLEAAARQSVDP